MNFFYKIKKWEFLHPVLFTVLRIILGVCLTVQGIYFLNNSQSLEAVINRSQLQALNLTAVIAIIITWIHLLGGTLIILGLFTRIAVWAQIPILLGVFIFINSSEMAVVHSDILFSIFILILLGVFAFEGGGNVSMDAYLKRHLL